MKVTVGMENRIDGTNWLGRQEDARVAQGTHNTIKKMKRLPNVK